MDKLTIYLLFGGAISAVAFIVYVIIHRWTSHREFENYRSYGKPSELNRAGDYQHFLALWRRYRENCHTYIWPHPSHASSRLTLGAYLRKCELMEETGNNSASSSGGSGVDMEHSPSVGPAQAGNPKNA